jgi:hypothetical protein
MDKRFQVFLSSTYVDLTEERLEVIKALLELDCIPSGMEYFPAASEESWSYIANLINQCDYYIVIVGGRYGSESDDGVSFTQKEYLHAQSQGIPCIAFTHAKPDELPAKNTEQSPEGRKKLADFVALLRKNSLCKNWATAHELGAVVSRSVTQLIKQHPRTGWIPANQAGNPKATEEILTLTKKVSELQEELRKVRGHFTLDTTSLAEGEDFIELNVIYAVSAEVEGDRWTRPRVIAKGDGRVTVTWNDLFRAIAPRIAPYASDASIQNGINGLLTDRFPEPTDMKEGEWISGVTLTKESFNTVKIQFLALGLITVGKEEIEKEYGKKGTTGILWRLTEAGTVKMTHTLAVKKPVT